MKVKRLGALLAVLVGLVLALCAGPARAGNQDEMKAGKKTEIGITKTAKIGEKTLKAGQYEFQHVVSAGQHIAIFVGPKDQGAKGTVEVKCTNEPLKQKATQTFVLMENDGGVDKITRIEIAGEDVAHVF